MPSAIRQSGPRPALRHLAPTGNAPASRDLPTTAQRVGSECPDRLAMDFGGAGAAQQGLTDSCQSGGVPTAVQNLATRAAAAAAAPRAVAPYKYASSVRSPHPAIQPLQAPQPAVHVQGQEPLTASMLAAAPPQEQKQMLGERLFPLIQTMHSNLAGKITGMLLDRQLRAAAHAGVPRVSPLQGEQVLRSSGLCSLGSGGRGAAVNTQEWQREESATPMTTSLVSHL